MIKRTVVDPSSDTGVRAPVTSGDWAEAGVTAAVANIADIDITAQGRVRLIGVYGLSVTERGAIQ
ncbi:hypothetical protein [Streptomyces sp. NPDC026673]|uniref:hypothetical protein n=1 Tax=Streptomyces sp. NPDC026673 TaxID=3155724 RepID=UPI0033E0D58C